MRGSEHQSTLQAIKSGYSCHATHGRSLHGHLTVLSAANYTGSINSFKAWMVEEASHSFSISMDVDIGTQMVDINDTFGTRSWAILSKSPSFLHHLGLTLRVV